MTRSLLAIVALLAGLFAATALAQAPAALRHDERLTVVVHTAANCPICKLWSVSPEGLPVARQLPQRWPRVQVVYIERPSLHGSETGSLYPPDLQHLFQARQERYQLSPPVPFFEIVRGREIVTRYSGMQGWTDGILPALASLEATRAAAGSAPLPATAR